MYNFVQCTYYNVLTIEPNIQCCHCISLLLIFKDGNPAFSPLLTCFKLWQKIVLGLYFFDISPFMSS